MKVFKTELEGVLVIEPDVFRDERGFFLESYSKRKYEEIGIYCEFVQDNHSRSVRGVVRGLHFQRGEGQAKLVRCTRGRIFDVVVDIRKNSHTLGKWVGVELSEENMNEIFIPAGFAHGFSGLDEINDVLYKCDRHYDSELEYQIAWDDPVIAVEWPLNNPIVSKRDQKGILFREYLKNNEF